MLFIGRRYLAGGRAPVDGVYEFRAYRFAPAGTAPPPAEDRRVTLEADQPLPSTGGLQAVWRYLGPSE